MHTYLQTVYKELEAKYYYQPEFLQAVEEVFDSIDEVIKNDKTIIESNIIRRMVEPDRVISFKVVWIDDEGKYQVNKGYRVQFNQALGPYKGGLRFHPSVNESILKFLGFEQTLKNSLTAIPMGGAKGGSDFNPKGKSDHEIMRFCQAFMIQLYKYIGPDIDIPAGDIGVSSKEVGFLFGMYKQITTRHNGTLTGKAVSYGGSLVRKEATGYGLCYLANKALEKYYHTDFKGKRVIVSGSGNVGIYAAHKAVQLGAKVVAISSTTGFLYDEDGLDMHHVEAIKSNKQPQDIYLKKYKDTKFYEDYSDIWDVKCDIALPCATQNELGLDDVKKLVKNGVQAVFEGANMPTTPDAIAYLMANKVLFVPGKAANAGGVVVSGLEMQQNAMHTQWDFEQVDMNLKEIMENILEEIYQTAKQYNDAFNLVKGANIASFKKVYQAMLEQGI